jgi:hypothetical protein
MTAAHCEALSRGSGLGRRGETLTRLAALGTLSRGAGEGTNGFNSKPFSRTAGEGGTKREGLGG